MTAYLIECAKLWWPAWVAGAVILFGPIIIAYFMPYDKEN